MVKWRVICIGEKKESLGAMNKVLFEKWCWRFGKESPFRQKLLLLSLGKRKGDGAPRK